MKKDYMPVDSNNLGLSEIDLVESQWTATWQRIQADPAVLATKIARREEYRLMIPYLKQIQRGGRILDAGCGQGEWTIYLAGGSQNRQR